MNGETMRVMAMRGAMAATVLAVPSIAWACCPSDDKGAPKAARGLGESLPATVDLAADPDWQIYEFERDGLRYTQINDATGKVRAAVGRVGGTAWVLPIGQDADRVRLPGDSLPVGTSRVLMRSREVEVLLIQSEGTDYWLVRPLMSAD